MLNEWEDEISIGAAQIQALTPTGLTRNLKLPYSQGLASRCLGLAVISLTVEAIDSGTYDGGRFEGVFVASTVSLDLSDLIASR